MIFTRNVTRFYVAKRFSMIFDYAAKEYKYVTKSTVYIIKNLK